MPSWMRLAAPLIGANSSPASAGPWRISRAARPAARSIRWISISTRGATLSSVYLTRSNASSVSPCAAKRPSARSWPAWTLRVPWQGSTECRRRLTFLGKQFRRTGDPVCAVGIQHSGDKGAVAGQHDAREDAPESIGTAALAEACQCGMIRQRVVQTVAGKSADREAGLRLAHQPPGPAFVSADIRVAASGLIPGQSAAPGGRSLRSAVNHGSETGRRAC